MIQESYDLSIIIPAFNTEKTIVRCIRSCLKSLLGANLKYEIIVVNDGSNCDLKPVLGRIGCENIKLIEHDRNRSLFQARRTGFLSCNGRYVVSFDSDDFVIDVKFNKIVAYLDQYCIDAIKIPFIPGVKNVEVSKFIASLFNRKSLLLENNFAVWRWFTSMPGHWNIWNCFFRKNLIDQTLRKEEFDNLYINLAEDFLYSSLIFKNASKVLIGSDLGEYYYDYNSSSIYNTSFMSKESIFRSLDDYKKVRQIYLKLFEGSDKLNSVEALYSSNIPSVLGAGCKFVNNKEFFELLCQSFRRQDVEGYYNENGQSKGFIDKKLDFVERWKVKLFPRQSYIRLALWFMRRNWFLE